MGTGAGQRRRLPPEARREEFVDAAIAFFAEEGFESSTRDLARRLGVTQPLLYRYFPSKDDLINEVYRRVYVERWRPDWEDLIADRSRPIRVRLSEFYCAYTDAIFRPDWIRIFLYSGLRGVEINRRYLGLISEKVIEPVIAECRHAAGQPPAESTEEERDFAWLMHGGIFYFGVIKLVYQGRDPLGKDRAIELAIDALVDGLVARARGA